MSTTRRSIEQQPDAGKCEVGLQDSDRPSSLINHPELTTVARCNGFVAIDKPYTPFFSSLLSNHQEIYGNFLALDGRPIKQEKRTFIKIISRINGCETRTAMSFVFKVYHYSHMAGISTLRQMSKAEREFRALYQCQNLGVPAVQPVGFGTLSGRFGKLRSCFVMTRLVENATDFRNWLKEKDKWRIIEPQCKAAIVGQLGRHLRRLHEERFFLMRPSPKNILIYDENTLPPKLMFVDLAYARFLTSELLARHAQRIDLGRLFGPLLRRGEYDLLDDFLGTYLPDPFGRTFEDLRRLIVRAARVQSNRTLSSWVSNKIQRTSIRRIRRAVRKSIRYLTSEEYRDEWRKKARGKRFPDG